MDLIGGMVTYNEAAAYLRIDLFSNEKTIADICLMAEIVCKRTAKLTDDIWVEISDYYGNDAGKRQMKEILRIGVLYAIGWFYEHGLDADQHDVILTLRNLYFSIREGKVKWE